MERIRPRWGFWRPRRAGARTKRKRGWNREGLKDLRIVKRAGRSASARPVGPGEVAPRKDWAATPQHRPYQPRSYRFARVRSQVLEVGAVDGLQSLQLMLLPLRVALRRLVPAAPGGPTAPSHGDAVAQAGRPCGGGGGHPAGSGAGLRSPDWPPLTRLARGRGSAPGAGPWVGAARRDWAARRGRARGRSGAERPELGSAAGGPGSRKQGNKAAVWLCLLIAGELEQSNLRERGKLNHSEWNDNARCFTKCLEPLYLSTDSKRKLKGQTLIGFQVT